MRLFSLLLVSLFLFACRHQVQIESMPYGADVYWQEKNIGNTPLQYTFWWYPFRTISLQVHYFGYRDTPLEIHRSISTPAVANELLHIRIRTLLGLKTRATHTAVLVPEHGPAGTWTPEDAQSYQ